MAFDLIVGFIMSAPLFIGAMVFPRAIWSLLEKSLLRKRGVRLIIKIGVVFLSAAPAILTFVAIGNLMDALDVGASARAWEEARKFHPRAFPLEALPLAVGIVVGIIILSPYYDNLLRLVTISSDRKEEKKVGLRSEKRENLHPLEHYVNKMFISSRLKSRQAVDLSNIASYVASPPHVRRKFYEAFLSAEFWVVTKRNIGDREPGPKDIFYSSGTVIVAEDKDCLDFIPRSPIAKIQATRLLPRLKEGTSIVINQPEITLNLTSDDLNKIRNTMQQVQ